MELKDTITAWLITLAVIAGILWYFSYRGIIAFSLESIIPLTILSLILFVIIRLLHLLLERIVIPHWIRSIIFLIILPLFFLLPIIPSKMPAECLVPPCGYHILFTSVYKLFYSFHYVFSYPMTLINWATIFTYPIIVFEIVAAYFLSKPAASWVEKVIAKISKKTNPS